MARKGATPWKQKRRYEVLAPENFDSQVLGTTVAGNPKDIVGRTVDISLKDLLGDRSKQHLKLVFKVSEIKGDKAITNFSKFDVAPGYLRSKIRKGMSKIDYVSDLKLEDSRVMIGVMIMTHQKVNASQKKRIVGTISRSLKRYNSSKLNQLVQFILFGKLGTDIYKGIKKICPISWVEVRHLEVL